MTRHTISEPYKAWGQCWIVTRRILKRDGGGAIHASGYNYERRSHWALYDEATDVVTDHTMRQFDATCAAPWVGPADEWMDLMSDFLNDDVTVLIYTGVTFTEEGDIMSVDMLESSVMRDAEPGPMSYPPGQSEEANA